LQERVVRHHRAYAPPEIVDPKLNRPLEHPLHHVDPLPRPDLFVWANL